MNKKTRFKILSIILFFLIILIFFLRPDKNLSLYILIKSMDKNEIKFFLEKNKSNVKSFINEPLITRNIDKFSKKNYWNALSFAIMFADIEIIEILIKYGANVNHRYDNLDSPIHIAIRLRSAKKDASFGMPADYLKIIKLLLKHNADLTLKNKEGYTPIEYAAKYNDTELVKLLESLKNEK